MLSFVAGLLQTSPQERPTEHSLEERTKAVFAQCDLDSDGKLTKQDLYNYLVDSRINVSHIVQDKAFRTLSGGNAYLTLPQLLQASCLLIGPRNHEVEVPISLLHCVLQ